MNNQKIGPYQLFTLMYLFELGTAIVIGTGLTAKQDAWWILLLSTGIGIILLLIYTALYRMNKNLPLTSLIPRILGRFLGIPLSLLYILLFMNTAARDVRDLMELIIISILPYTSKLTIGAVIMILVAYAIFVGIEPLGRAGEIFFVIILILGSVGTILLFFTGHALQIKRFFPLFQVNWREILTNTLPITINVPFGESVAFTMLFPYLNQAKAVRKAGISAMLLAGLSLCLTAVLEIAALGPYIASTSVFPLHILSQQVNVLNFLQRLDAIAISVMMICIFFKITIFTYAAYIGINDLFKIKKKRLTNFIICIIIFSASILMAHNTVEHLFIGLKIFPIFILTPMQIAIPLLLLLVAWIRKDRLKSL
ncbi:GerAB/ArcD/ProY family transporter [Heyndrickxia acidicola]|uniref:GerAB/ArcD/ProY family transporter n=1 Tax=Heyndrickxia acidicola TaxID=209389 RepID=A0ABU6MJ54_9BACI|nr:GerAB/ArcD/ProY family transporter [Heyndrickxia acidicola]MED1204560.1 GerAB/ArcD/ProY family transporter [Heyndrickxia acidicola]